MSIHEIYPDLYNEHEDPRLNYERARLYATVLFLLNRYFGFDRDDTFAKIEDSGGPGAPPLLKLEIQPADFGTAKQAAAKVQILTVYGYLEAHQMLNPGKSRDGLNRPDGNELAFRWDSSDVPPRPPPPGPASGTASGLFGAAASLRGAAAGLTGAASGLSTPASTGLQDAAKNLVDAAGPAGAPAGPGGPGPVQPSSTDRIELVHISTRFVETFTRAVQQYNASRTLCAKVYEYLFEVGEASKHTYIFASQLAEVVIKLASDGVNASAPQVRLKIACAVNEVCGCGPGGAGGAGSGGGSGTAASGPAYGQSRLSGINIDLPELDGGLSVEIISENILALSVLYFASQLEDMRLFSVADKVCDLFQLGQLPITKGDGADNLFEYIKTTYLRFTEAERRGMYSRAFGFNQGVVDASLPNSGFSNLWIRSLSAVSVYARQNPTPYSANADGRTDFINLNVVDQSNRIHYMQVYKTLRDLSVNLSLHGYAMAHYSAIELQATIRHITDMLAHPDVLSAFGVRDYFQLIERVASMYMNSEVNSLRQRVMAQSGSRIIQWLAEHAKVLASPQPPEAHMFRDIRLVDNVEKWLAVTGTTFNTLEQYSAPIPTPNQSTIPTLSALRNMTASVEGAMKDIAQTVKSATPSVPEA